MNRVLTLSEAVDVISPSSTSTSTCINSPSAISGETCQEDLRYTVASAVASSMRDEAVAALTEAASGAKESSAIYSESVRDRHMFS